MPPPLPYGWFDQPLWSIDVLMMERVTADFGIKEEKIQTFPRVSHPFVVVRTQISLMALKFEIHGRTASSLVFGPSIAGYVDSIHYTYLLSQKNVQQCHTNARRTKIKYFKDWGDPGGGDYLGRRWWVVIFFCFLYYFIKVISVFQYWKQVETLAN